jgi:predicted TPR repeat methyltransferase
MTFYIMGELESCIEVLNQWLELEPDNPTALHLHAAYSGGDAPVRASDAYVRQTFDGFAASFDGVLKRLNYQAPFLVQAALERLQPDAASWRLLDAGCGTGLFGALIRPLVKHLAGVDLSPRMLERADVRGIYDVLYEAELTEFFAQVQEPYAAISCVDTFCYFGDLSAAVEAAVTALQPGGWFVFTLEELVGEAHADYHLEKHGRYSHAETYVRRVLAEAGFTVISLEKAELRREGADQVRGLIVTARATLMPA